MSQDRDSFSIYMEELRRFPLLGAEKEREIAVRARAGDADAQLALVNHNLRLAASIARRFWTRIASQGGAVGLMDLVQYANIGLLRAVEKYEPERGFRFSTYATWWIRQSTIRGYQNDGNTMRRPVHFTERVVELRRVQARLTDSLKREPTTEEVAAALGLSIDKTLEVQQIIAPLLELDGVPVNAKSALSDLIPDTTIPADVLADEAAVRLLVGLAFGGLDDRERYVLRRRYGLAGDDPSTLEAIAEGLNLTRERVRQIHRDALARLKTKVASAEKSRRFYTGARAR